MMAHALISEKQMLFNLELEYNGLSQAGCQRK